MVGLTAVYLLPLILAFAGFALTLKYIPESRATGDLQHMNVIALVIWTFGLCVLIFAGVLAGGLGWTHPLVIGGLIVGGGLIIILKWLDGVDLPEKWRFKLLFQRQLSVAVYAGVILNVALYAITVQVFNFLNEVQDYNAILAGLALAPILAGAVLVVALSARLALHWRLAQALSASLLVIAMPAIVLSLLSPDISYWVLLPSLISSSHWIGYCPIGRCTGIFIHADTCAWFWNADGYQRIANYWSIQITNIQPIVIIGGGQ